jgi:hypothetical protein
MIGKINLLVFYYIKFLLYKLLNNKINLFKPLS